MNFKQSSNKKTSLQTASDTNYAGVAELWAIEESLKKYNADVVHKLTRFFNNRLRILEFGAGIGTLAELWSNKTGITPECLEIDVDLNRVIQERGFICYENLDDIGGLFDGIYTSNVLEHIEDDGAILGKLYEKLEENGILAVYVPAFMCLYSNMDLAVGHYRRYTAKDLCGKLESSGFEIIHQSYSDGVGFFVWLYLKMRNRHGGGELSNYKMLSIYDKFVYPISCFFDAVGIKRLFGKNLLVIAKK